MNKHIVSLGVTLGMLISQGSFAAVTSSQIDAANFLAEEEIIVDQSASPKLYELEKNIQRQAVMKVVMKLSERDVPDICRGEFADVDPNDWPCKYIEAALDAGYIAKNTNFRPYDDITLTEAMKLVLKSKGIQKIEETDNWQADYMETAYHYGIIDEKYYNYNDNASRGWIFEIATATIKKQHDIYDAGGIISDEVSLESLKKDQVKEPSWEKDFFIITPSSWDKLVNKWDKNVEIGTYMIQISSDIVEWIDGSNPDRKSYIISESMTFTPEYGSVSSMFDTLYLVAQYNTPYAVMMSEFSIKNLEDGEDIVFMLDSAISSTNTFSIIWDISLDASPATKAAFTLSSFWEIQASNDVVVTIDQSSKWHDTIVHYEGYLGSYNAPVEVWLWNNIVTKKYLSHNAKNQDLGYFSIRDQKWEYDDGKRNFESMTFEIGGSIDPSDIVKFEISRKGSDVRYSWNISGNTVVFNQSPITWQWDNFQIYVDIESESTWENTLFVSLDSLKVKNSDEQYIPLSGFPISSSEFLVVDQSMSWNPEIKIDVTSDSGNTAETWLLDGQVLVGSIEIMVDDGDAYINSFEILKNHQNFWSDVIFEQVMVLNNDSGEFIWYFPFVGNTATVSIDKQYKEGTYAKYDILVLTSSVHGYDGAGAYFYLSDISAKGISNDPISVPQNIPLGIWGVEIVE